MDGFEVIDLCSVSQSKNDAFSEGKESAKQESQDKSKKACSGQNGSRIKDHKEQIHDQKQKGQICNDVLGVYEQLHGRRASKGTREGGEETHRKDRKAKT